MSSAGLTTAHYQKNTTWWGGGWVVEEAATANSVGVWVISGVTAIRVRLCYIISTCMTVSASFYPCSGELANDGYCNLSEQMLCLNGRLCLTAWWCLGFCFVFVITSKWSEVSSVSCRLLSFARCISNPAAEMWYSAVEMSQTMTHCTVLLSFFLQIGNRGKFSGKTNIRVKVISANPPIHSWTDFSRSVSEWGGLAASFQAI